MFACGDRIPNGDYFWLFGKVKYRTQYFSSSEIGNNFFLTLAIVSNIVEIDSQIDGRIVERNLIDSHDKYNL